jgi:Spy/CpxP family protein refolding chaperone
MRKTRLVLKKANLFLLLLAAVIVGFCIGFHTNAAIIRARVRKISTMPENMPAYLTEKLTKLLDLDDAQQTAIREIMERHDAKMQEARARGREIVDALVADLNAEVESQLTPEQRKIHAEHIEKMRQRGRENRQLRRAVQGTK